MSFQPRYDEQRGIYRDCKWCHGSGCLSCPAEADKEYKRQFPDGPQPIASFKTADLLANKGGLADLLKSLIGPGAIMDAKATARERIEEVSSGSFAGLLSGGQLLTSEEKDYAAAGMAGDIVVENIVKAAATNPLLKPKRRRKKANA